MEAAEDALEWLCWLELGGVVRKLVGKRLTEAQLRENEERLAGALPGAVGGVSE